MRLLFRLASSPLGFQNDFDTAAGHYARLLEYSGVVSSAVMEPALDEITALVQGSKAALTFCQETYNIRKV